MYIIPEENSATTHAILQLILHLILYMLVYTTVHLMLVSLCSTSSKVGVEGLKLSNHLNGHHIEY